MVEGVGKGRGRGRSPKKSIHSSIQLIFAWLHLLTKILSFVDWERGVDSHGRVYYIDHVNRTTTWVRPRQSKMRKFTLNL